MNPVTTNWGASPVKDIRVYRMTNQVLFDFADEYKEKNKEQ